MPCEKFRFPDGTVGIICSRGRRSTSKHCSVCDVILTRDNARQCDYPTGRTKRGKLKSCDKYLCSECARPGISPNIDFCPEPCYRLASEAHARREARKLSAM